MVTLTEDLKSGAGHYLVSEASGYRSREVGTIVSGAGVLKPGTVLGKITDGGAVTVTKTDVGGGKGALTLADPAYGAGVKEGVYKVILIEPAANAGAFEVEDPDGIVIGTGTVGVAFTGVVKFTLADGGTDFAAGDIALVTVAIADPTNLGKYAVHDPAAVNGAQVPAAILYQGCDATSADVKRTLTVRDTEVHADVLTWKSGMTDDQKAAALAVLSASHGIVAR
ncbi:head decoration protein [Xanthobacter flavus]|uniref:head decoration protein n=1 Tax=Xanthobacter flavus TaxID=281 RepID=UPI00372C476F